ncbi:TPA_asm: P [Scutellaria alphacytorhabdovirus 1]|nr:TPA_asm: P [Scutellaria alphacytorhabdovirus 1]
MADTGEFDDLEYGMASSGDFPVDPEDYDDGGELDHSVPAATVSDDQKIDHGNKDDIPNTKMMVKQLVECGKEMGVQVDQEMINVVLSGASVYEFSEDAMRWFILGVTFMNNKRIVPEFTDIITSLRTEIKALQQTNTAIKASSSDITKKMTSVKDDVLAGFEKLRAGVIDQVIEMEEKKHSQSQSSQLPIQSVSAKTKGIQIISEHTDPSSSIKSSPQQTVPLKKDNRNPVLSDKIKILIGLGGNLSVISSLDEEDICLYITDEELAELTFGEDDAIKNDIKDEILIRLDESELL